MRDLVLASLRNLCQREFAFEHVGPEQGVVAEAVFTLRLMADAAFNDALSCGFGAVFVDEDDGAGKVRGALIVGDTRKGG